MLIDKVLPGKGLPPSALLLFEGMSDDTEQLRRHNEMGELLHSCCLRGCLTRFLRSSNAENMKDALEHAFSAEKPVILYCGATYIV